jgi:hypothetical protein
MSMRWLRWWIVGYFMLACVAVFTMLAVRDRAIRELSTPQSIAQWQAWKADVAQKLTIPGPVQRRVPRSNEPPALVLMRDYFAVSLAGAVLFCSALYWVIAWLVSGMFTTKTKL